MLSVAGNLVAVTFAHILLTSTCENLVEVGFMLQFITLLPIIAQ